MAWSEARSTPSRCSLAEPSGQIRATAAARLPAAVSGQMTISRPAYGRAVDCADRHPLAPSGASLSVGSRKRRFKRRYNRGRPGFVLLRSPMIRCTYRPKTRPNTEVTRLQTLTQNESIYFRTLYRHSRAAGIQGRSPVARPRPEPVLGPAEGRTRGSGQATPAFAGVRKLGRVGRTSGAEGAVRASTRPLRGLLSMRWAIDGIIEIPHPEAPRAARPRRTQGVDPASVQIDYGLFRGGDK